jgi:hypothetical protein
VSATFEMTETDFRRVLLVHIGARSTYRVWAQNCGRIAIRDNRGSVQRYFDAGPPEGAADISGVVIPEGWRIEFELKGPRTRVKQAQTNWGERMGEFGAVYALYRIDASRSLVENLDRAAYELDVAIEVKRRGAIRSENCACGSCEIVQQLRPVSP